MRNAVLFISGDHELHSPILPIGSSAVLMSHCGEAVEAVERSGSVGRRIRTSALAADERMVGESSSGLNRPQELAVSLQQCA